MLPAMALKIPPTLQPRNEEAPSSRGLTAACPGFFPLVFSARWLIPFRVPMIVKWLMICATLAGLGVRAAPHIHAYSHSHSHCHEHGHHHHDHDHHEAPAEFHTGGLGDESRSPDPDGGSGKHHHQHVCCHFSPLVLDGADEGQQPPADFSLLGVMPEGFRIPAEPVFELDTPPLI
jgi:hypothetical protein